MDEFNKLIDELVNAARKLERVFGGYAAATPKMEVVARADAERAHAALLAAYEAMKAPATPAEPETCGGCRFHAHDSCRRRSPVVVPSESGTWNDRWPVVPAYGWCGEFEARP